jgi:hypothetical protein
VAGEEVKARIAAGNKGESHWLYFIMKRGRQGDRETSRQGDREMRRKGNTVT